MQKLGWDQLDVVIVSGDAYVDHPAWAAALLGRFLESRGYRVGVLAQPDWNNPSDIGKLGSPRLLFAVSAGNMDSMVNHYTADLRKRRQDLYSPGGRVGLRPDRATIVYSNLIRQHFPRVPVIIGGIEASLRRFAHYDYWSGRIRRSILLDSKADLLVYGMGEYALEEIAGRIKQGEPLTEIKDVRGTCYWSRKLPEGAVQIPSFEKCSKDPRHLTEAALVLHREVNPYCARIIAEPNGERWVVQNPPPLPLNVKQMDQIYAMDFSRTAHPGYENSCGIPALAPVQFSITSHRGCFGGCSFCSLALHQGKFIQSRSVESIIKEARKITEHKDFKGTISDVGGPSANMYSQGGIDADRCKSCRKFSCLFPEPCPNLNAAQAPSIKLLKRLRSLKEAKHIYISSGIRYDLVLKDNTQIYLKDLLRYHVGGQLKIAPEHISENITRLMNKPAASEYRRFIKLFNQVKKELDKDLYMVPYFISGHPGSSIDESIELARFLKKELHFQPEQIQNFTPTPMTFSTCMYAAGVDPFSGKVIHVPRGSKERSQQRALLQCRVPRNKPIALQALREAGREDLIGTGPDCLLAEKDNGRGERSASYTGNNKRRKLRERKDKNSVQKRRK